jgi:hypothetical protein
VGSGDPRRASGRPGQTHPAALPRASLGRPPGRDPEAAGSFVLQRGAGAGGTGLRLQSSLDPRRASPCRTLASSTGPRTEGIRGPGPGELGRGSRRGTHLPFQLHRSLEYCAPTPPSSTASNSSSSSRGGGGPGPGTGGRGHSCPARPRAARAAPRMLQRVHRPARVRAPRIDPPPGATGGAGSGCRLVTSRALRSPRAAASPSPPARDRSRRGSCRSGTRNCVRHRRRLSL